MENHKTWTALKQMLRKATHTADRKKYYFDGNFGSNIQSILSQMWNVEAISVTESFTFFFFNVGTRTRCVLLGDHKPTLESEIQTKKTRSVHTNRIKMSKRSRTVTFFFSFFIFLFPFCFFFFHLSSVELLHGLQTDIFIDKQLRRSERTKQKETQQRSTWKTME